MSIPRPKIRLPTALEGYGGTKDIELDIYVLPVSAGAAKRDRKLRDKVWEEMSNQSVG